MEIERLSPSDLLYPIPLASGLEKPELAYLGNPEILRQPLLGVLCSVKCPATLILKAHDTARELANQGQAVISGFQSPVEKEILTMLLRGNGTIILCLARGLNGMRISKDWRPAIDAGKMLVISPFDGQVKRPTDELARQRNHFVATLAARILFIHARPGGSLESLLREMLVTEKPFYAIQNGSNDHLLQQGAKTWEGGG
ncbi:MAG: DNA-processing protein DprA [Chloroflexi bacterium]|nr:DNA-processing protein DprA [Chloroflexota bacterium]